MSNSLTLFPDLLPSEPSEPSDRQISPVQESTITAQVDEDVVICSPGRYEQAVKHSRRINVLIEFRLPDCDYLSEHAARSSSNITPRRRDPARRMTNRNIFIDLEASEKTESENPDVPPPEVAQPIQVKEPTINCPICLNAISEPTATKCGHIFCKNCITDAFAAQRKCPTCRRKLTKRDTMFRVYLP